MVTPYMAMVAFLCLMYCNILCNYICEVSRCRVLECNILCCVYVARYMYCAVLCGACVMLDMYYTILCCVHVALYMYCAAVCCAYVVLYMYCAAFCCIVLPSDWVHCEEKTGAYYQLSQFTYKLVIFYYFFKVAILPKNMRFPKNSLKFIIHFFSKKR